MDDLVSNDGFVTGRRRYLRTVTPGDAADIATHLHGQVDRGTRARADVARRDGVVLACKLGCTGCCEELVLVKLPEALAVARWLLLPENAAARATFLAGYGRWRAAVGDAPERLADLLE